MAFWIVFSIFILLVAILAIFVVRFAAASSRGYRSDHTADPRARKPR